MKRAILLIYLFWIVTGVITLFYLYFPAPCSGYSGIYKFLVSAAIFVLGFLILVSAHIIMLNKGNRKYAMMPLGILALFYIIYLIMPMAISQTNHGREILLAKAAGCKCGGISSLILWEDQTYEIHLSSSEYTCRFSGHYLLHQDTLRLNGNILSKTDSRYFPVYFINSPDSLLIPLNEDRHTSIQGKDLRLELFDNRKSLARISSR